jgi:hypothetical protein
MSGDPEQIARAAAKAAADALRPALRLAKVAEQAARVWDDAMPNPRLRATPQNAATNANTAAGEAVRLFDWIAAGMPPPIAKEAK